MDKTNIQPLVSVVICCHNRAEYLPATLESVFDQTYQNIEIIVLDDNSTDKTEMLMASYAGRLIYIKALCGSAAKARNRAVALASGDYIAFQDDDDIMPCNRISDLLEALQAFPQASYATGDFALIDSKGALTGGRWMPANSVTRNSCPQLIASADEAVFWPKTPAVPHTTLIKREYGEKIGWFDEKFTHAGEDADLLVRLGRFGPVAYLPVVVSHYRRGHSSLTSKYLETECSRLFLWDRHFTRVEQQNPPVARRLQLRISGVVKDLLKYATDQNLSASDPESYRELKKYLALGTKRLSKTQRVKLAGFKGFKLPLRQILKVMGYNRESSHTNKVGAREI